MTRNEIIQGLQFTINMFLFDPSTGESFKEPKNDLDKTTVDACKGAIELLTQEPCKTSKLSQKAYEDGKKDGYVEALTDIIYKLTN